MPEFDPRKVEEFIEEDYNVRLAVLNKEFKDHVSTGGRFSLVLDTWKQGSSTYLGVVVCYIDANYKLVHRLVGMYQPLLLRLVIYILFANVSGLEPFDESFSADQVLDIVKGSLNPYPSLAAFDNIFSVTCNKAKHYKNFHPLFVGFYGSRPLDVECSARMFDCAVDDIIDSLQKGEIKEGTPGFHLLQRVERMTIQVHTLRDLSSNFADYQLLENYRPGKYY